MAAELTSLGLKVGVSGYGIAGAVFHAPLIEAVDGLELAAVMTRSDERAAQVREAHPGARVVASVGDLLDGIELLVVASPNSTHVELALAGLERGLHVVVDKPMAVTAADARRMAKAADGRLTVFHNRRWDGDFMTVQRLVRDGELGHVTRFESRFERFRPQIKEGWREEADAAVGGGALLDLGPHLVDQALHLFGPVDSVYGEVLTRRPEAKVDDDAFIALRHAGGQISHLWMSAIAPLHGPRFRVSGLAAGFACDGLDPQEPQLRDGMRPSDRAFGEAPPGRIVGEDDERPVELERGNYVAYYERVRDWVRGDGAPPVDPWDGVRVLEILEAARRG
ncbi:MAG TPA: Gfo/Idh/MocA family oxidoreductase [Thermoleophilaceae bacterium]|jgi:predicted dehydrogenase|nr:Gfo/Idh/MocA family oxidoreductase [Thermoleophilaceae bacterium]